MASIWELQTETDKLPPIKSALMYKIFRNHYVALVLLKRSYFSLKNLPPPEDFAWEKIDTKLVPPMTHCLPAPMALIELHVCGWNQIAKPIDANVRKTILLVQISVNGDNSGTQENGDSDIEIDDEESDWLLKLIQRY